MQPLSFSDLHDKVCAITGGAGIIGASLVEALASAGVKVAVVDRDGDKARGLAQRMQRETGTPALGVVADVLDKPSLERAREEITKALGPIDLLINCAGGNHPSATTKAEFILPEAPDGSTFFDLDIAGFSKVFDLNFAGTVLPTMVFARDMTQRKSGAVLNISSMNSYRPLTRIPAYSAAKAAINNFTQWLAVHFAKVNVRVNAIAPGFFLTDQNRFLLTDEKSGELTPRGNKIITNTPMGEFGTPADLQGAALFLLSSATARFITGVVLAVDGGFSAYSGV
jgi:NAD(P)-dependent dehydrogenase (short-subunit alcohol dehydrogenase family)